ncbi:PIN domain-containing protein [bacterium]|nr:PIN domain-containing protein [bacterium]
MAKAKPPKVYWDSCIFLALLKNETYHGERALRHMDDMYQACLKGDLDIVTSALWRLEVLLERHVQRDTHQLMEDAFHNEVFLSVSATEQIFSKVAELRFQLGIDKKTLLLGDAIHVATALCMGCPVLYSTDKHMLGVAGLIPGLRIEKPQAAPELFDEA